MSQQRQQVFRHGLQLSLPNNSSGLSTTVSQATSSILSDIPNEIVNEEDRLAATPTSTPPFHRPTIKKRRKAWIYKYMRDTDNIEAIFFNTAGKSEWRCQYCTTNYQLSGGTSNIERHLMKTHQVFEDSPKDIRATQQQINISDALTTAETNPRMKRRRMNDYNPVSDLHPDVLEVLYVKFIATCNVPLRLVESPEFRALLSYINPDIETWLPDSHNTIREWVMKQYLDQKRRMKQRLQSSRTKIHIACDLWTSPNSLAIFGIVAHYISEDNVLESSVLALKEVQGSHDGPNLATIIMEVVNDWGLANKLGFFIMDNASNNDNMMLFLSLSMLVWLFIHSFY